MKIAAWCLTVLCFLYIYNSPCLGNRFFSIGDEEDEEIFYPVQVAEGPDGNIYIYDYQTVFINVFSPEGRLYGLDGKRKGEIKTSLPEPQQVTDRDLEAWRKNLAENIRNKSWFARFGSVIYKYKTSLYEKKPNLDSISLTPDHHLLIGESRTPGQTRGKYRLLDTKGTTIAAIEVTGQNLQVTRHFVFLIARDEEENPVVRVMKRTEKESEKDSLLKFAAYKGTAQSK